MVAIRVREYIDAYGRSPFRRWFGRLDADTAARVAIAIARLADGNLATLKSLGGGVMEARLDFGPGYRIYLGRDGDALIILLCGGTKPRQQRDIAQARELWREYRRRRRHEG